jgi:hypothetical protein
MKNHTNFKFSMLVIALALGSTSARVFALDNAMEEGNQSAYVSAFKA